MLFTFTMLFLCFLKYEAAILSKYYGTVTLSWTHNKYFRLRILSSCDIFYKM